ncbi:MAG: hypothetical protein K1000chlam2_00689 [Chlamydiae bacterium]|nr:hypothetical protein [Chlamydiota bacterium]
MELNQWATRILSADTLEEKLLEPAILSDDQPGPALFWDEPTRPPGLEFQKHARKDKLPPLHELAHSDKRAICLHRFAGHELLAVEIMAYALLAFPEAPKHFRRGVANTLREEQEHVRLYLHELKRFNIHLDDLPLFRHFWAYTPFLRTPEEYLSVMSLTFEMANLDYAPMYGACFSQHGDQKSAQLMERILRDEIAHVSFGWNWLKKLKPAGVTEWDVWMQSLPDRMPPKRAMGTHFQEENRRKAGISDAWLASFKDSLKN